MPQGTKGSTMAHSAHNQHRQHALLLLQLSCGIMLGLGFTQTVPLKNTDITQHLNLPGRLLHLLNKLLFLSYQHHLKKFQITPF